VSSQAENGDTSRPHIQKYLDFREYLKDWIDWRRAKDAEFSQRVFAKEAGLPLSSSSLLPAVLKGRRNLSQNLRVQFATALKLNERDSRYFELLVQFNQAKGMEEKNHFFAQLTKFRTSRAQILQDTQMEFFSKWSYSAVRNYFGMDSKQSNPAVIGERLLPKVSATEVQEAIRLLSELGLIKKTANGFTVTDRHIFTSKDVQARTARGHLKELTRMAMEVLDEVPPEVRQYNALMFTISPEGFQTVKERIRSFMEELREIIDRDHGEDRIYSMTLQLFPNSQLPEKGEAGRGA
jgi:uncharacterized protein (TIGR02147 family)